jgi:peptidoglycan hydrolase-like protein with peptidoglycan-binding domain
LAAGGTSLAFAAQSSAHSSPASTTTTTTPPATTVETIPRETVTAPTTSTTAAPIPPDPEVLARQQKLNDLGYWLGSVDGHMGGATQQAVYAFQKLHGLARTGTFNAPTVAALDTATRPTPASTSGDLIEVDKKHQVILIVRGGAVLWAFNTSTGTESPYVTDGTSGFAHTPTGTFAVSRVVDRVDPGPLGPLYRPRYFTSSGIAIHGAGLVPPQPASHGCARVTNAAMDFIWANNLMPMRSTVWVYDDPAVQPKTAPVLQSPPATSVSPTTTALSLLTPATTAPTTTTTAPTATTSALLPLS